MGYRITFECPTCNSYSDGIGLTFNLAPMWELAGLNFDTLNGKDATHCASVLADALSALRRDPEKYKALNPKNGWGSYDGLIYALERLLDEAKSKPHGKLVVI
jgi:hypothetical protein